MKRIVIAAGGTGGHLYPGLAVAKELEKQGWEALFLVRTGDRGAQILEKISLKWVGVDMSGLPRRPSPKLLVAIWKAVKAFFLVRRILKSYKPSVVLGMGGYLTVPLGFAAREMGIPILIHESNVKPGLANRLVGKYAAKIACSFSETMQYFSSQRESCVLTGTPIRSDFIHQKLTLEQARSYFGFSAHEFVLLVFGGSLGAHYLNQNVVQALEILRTKGVTFQVIHLAGEKDYSWVEQYYHQSSWKAKVYAYFHEMTKAYFTADLVICRSGAGTLAELIFLKKPAVLIPYPFATADHQLENAQVLERQGCAWVLEEAQLSPEKLASKLQELASKGEPLQKMRSAYDALNVPSPEGAERRLADLIESRIAS